ncbi:HNH endonuclease [Candidatus Saccharibacteria bacterium]|nr:HNH endonuclease [Candidatus Saccharibacteria bacterium]
MTLRPAIPRDLKRRVLVEAGHRCAIPTCRSTQIEIAHIIPWEKVKKHEYENLIVLCPNCHTRFHNDEIDIKSIRQYKAQLRFLIETYSKFELDVIDTLYTVPAGHGIPFVKFMNILIKRLLDEKLVDFREISAGLSIGGVKSTPDLLLITDKGIRFVEDLRAGRAMSYEEIGEK